MSVLFSQIYEICCPYSHVIKDPSQREIALRRNLGILFSELASLVCMIFYIVFTTGAPNSVQKAYLFAIIGVLTVFLMCCRSYPNLFVTIYSLFVTAFGPVFHFCYKDSIFFNSIGVIVLPTWALCLSGSKLFFIAQVIIQNLYLHMLYKPQMLVVLDSMPPEIYFQKVTNLITFGVLVNAIFVFSAEIGLEKAHFKIIEAENRKFQLERQKTFFLSFSHEIRNLINSVIGNVNLCLLEELPTKVENLLGNLQICGEVLHYLVNNILDTGKLQFGGLEIDPSLHIMSDIWTRIWSICSQLIANKGLQGQFRLNKKVPRRLKIDRHRLMQIFLNLIGNSIKFTRRGSISIEIQWIDNQDSVNDKSFYPLPFSNDDQDEGLFEKNKAFDFFNNDVMVLGLDLKKISKEKLETRFINSNRGILRIIISDTGCGIPADKIPLIFDQFSQVHDDPSIRQLGTGLGLFITREIINKMNGEIKVFSQVGKGSTFIVCIPTESVHGE